MEIWAQFHLRRRFLSLISKGSGGAVACLLDVYRLREYSSVLVDGVDLSLQIAVCPLESR